MLYELLLQYITARSKLQSLEKAVAGSSMESLPAKQGWRLY